MEFSKIDSKSTYYRCIKELSCWSYLLYTPSHNPFKVSRIKMLNFGTSNEQVLYLSSTKIKTSTGQALVSINKHIQNIENSKNINKRQFSENSNSDNEENHLASVPYQDNLKTSSDRNYDDPL